MRKEIAGIKEKLDTSINGLPLEKKELRMGGKIFFRGTGERIGQLLWLVFG